VEWFIFAVVMLGLLFIQLKAFAIAYHRPLPINWTTAPYFLMGFGGAFLGFVSREIHDGRKRLS
jgi:hypothetical protein